MSQSIYLIGTNFRQAPLDRVGEIQWPDRKHIADFLGSARTAFKLEEIFFLQTCNRREFYIEATQLDQEDFLPRFLTLLSEDLGRSLNPEDFFFHSGHHVILHAMRTASSLESMVLGETEITRQIRTQMEDALQSGHMGRRLKALMDAALWASKQVRTHTSITRNVVSPASLAHRSILKHVAGRARKRVVFVGAGHYIQSILPTFTKTPELELVFVNRTYPKQLTDQYGGTAMALADFLANPIEFDAMVTATGASEHIFDAAFMQQCDDVLLMDAGIPRDIDPAVRALDNVRYMDLAEMEQILARNRAAREAEIPKADPIFAEAKEKLEAQWLEIDLAQYSREIAGHYRDTGEKALERLIKDQLSDLSSNDQELLRNWTRALVGKLTNIPILGLKGVARDLGDGAVDAFTRQVAEKAPLFRE